MKPTDHREKISFASGECPLGTFLLAQNSNGICALFFGDDSQELELQLQKQFPRERLIEDSVRLQPLLNQVVRWMETPDGEIPLPLDLQGTPFQKKVWRTLRKIPVGSRISYGELAAQIGNPRAFRAVGSACAANRLAVLIPCHRVIRRDGTLAHYRWGVVRKRKLLQREQSSSMRA